MKQKTSSSFIAFPQLLHFNSCFNLFPQLVQNISSAFIVFPQYLQVLAECLFLAAVIPDVNVAGVGESITDVTDKNEFVEIRETEPVDKAGWIVRRISELGGYENVSDSVKADVFGFDIADVSGSIRLFSDVMKRLEIKLDGDEMYEEFQRIYDESVSRDAGKDKAEDKMWNRGRGR